MKVALLSDCYPPRLGGIEVQVHDLAHHLVAAGHEVEVFTATPGPPGEAPQPLVHRLALPLPGGVPVNPFAPREVRRRLEAGGFDVAHGHMGVVSPFATDLVGVAVDVGVPTAVTWHCVVDRSAPVWRALGHARRWARAGAALSAVSAMAARRVEGIADAPVAVLGNGIDVAQWRRPDDHEKSGPFTVVSAMRLVTRKRPLALLQILRRLRELVPAEQPLAATVLGDGPQRGRMQHVLDRHDMHWVTLAGRVTRDALREHLWSGDAYLTTARLEAFGIAALEARTAGLPVVARAGTGADDFVRPGVDGLLGRDDDEIALALGRLVGDPDLRAGITAHNRRVPPAYDWSDIVSATLAEYRRAGA